jgi:preprotein translocase subunit SecF
MIRIFDKANYDLLAYRKIAFGIAAAFILPGIVWLVITGLNLSIEFTGGTLIVIEARDDAINTGSIRTAIVGAGIGSPEIQRFGSVREFAIRARLDPDTPIGQEASEQTRQAVEAALESAFGANAYSVILTEAVGPKVGGELREKAVLALLLGFGAILIYLSFRYEWRFGVAAVLTTMHDIVATFAFLSYIRLEVSLFVVASLLLMVGYSLNDTIVTFDRVRENLRKFKRAKLYEILNRSINETLPRTVLTSGSTLAASLALVLFGGEVLSGPLLVVTFGIVVGTFSSIYIAAPLLLAIERRWPGEDVRGARDIPDTVVSRTPQASA